MRRIILLTGDSEAPFLADELRRHDPALEIVAALNRDQLGSLMTVDTAQTRLISFCSSVIVPTEILAALGAGAYNFHPGPPEFPGRFPSVFALYKGASQFGVTAHEMTAAVDAGPIITADWFKIPGNCDLAQLEAMSFSALVTIFKRLAPLLIRIERRLTRMPYRWGQHKTKKADVEALCRLTADLSADEIELRRRVCGPFLKDAR